MIFHNKTATEAIVSSWNRLNPLPGGSWIFNLFLRQYNPYSASIRADVADLRPGYARVELQDKKQIRNHLNSIHAIALANLGELTSGLALLSGLPINARGIPTKISTEYFKKARGKLIAESNSGMPIVNESMDHTVSADIIDAQGDIVARTVVRWRLDSIE